MPAATDGDSVSLGFYAVAFFDLLGQQERLRSLRTLPNKNDPAEMEKVRDVLRQTYGAVYGMRKFFSDAFQAYGESRAEMDLGGLTETQRKEFTSWTSDPIHFRGFSDSLIAYMPLRTHDAAKLPMRGIFGILSAAATTFTCSLAVGHPIRAGIDIGLGFEHGDKEIYGPVLSRAYALESYVANYPRIVVGDEFVRYLSLMRDQAAGTPVAKVAIQTAKHCLDCLATDDDGDVFVDHMGPLFRKLIGDKVDGSVIERAYKKVLEFAEQAKSSRDSKLAFRYSRLKDYYEDRLPLWRDILPSTKGA